VIVKADVLEHVVSSIDTIIY